MRGGTQAYVVDTNVAVTANGKAEQAGPECVLACLDILQTIQTKGLIVLDETRHILREYQDHLSPSGQPGPGDIFMKWVWLNQFNTDYCEQVPITSVSEEEGHYAEFPDDPALKDFDRADRKFVAVARASRHNPIVCNATDTDWWKFRKALGRHRVQMEFLCPELMRNRGR